MNRAAPLVYIVEDDRAIRDLLEEVVSDAGYQVLACSVADEANNSISAMRPDVVIFDNQFAQHATGWALLSHLRASPATAALPLILLSMDAPHLHGWSDELYALGCYLVEKPFDLDTLLDTISAALGVKLIERTVGEA